MSGEMRSSPLLKVGSEGIANKLFLNLALKSTNLGSAENSTFRPISCI